MNMYEIYLQLIRNLQIFYEALLNQIELRSLRTYFRNFASIFFLPVVFTNWKMFAFNSRSCGSGKHVGSQNF